MLVQKLLSQKHLTAKPIDDKAAGRALQLYLQHLDPRKLYFVQSDVDEFQSQRETLDDASLTNYIAISEDDREHALPKDVVEGFAIERLDLVTEKLVQQLQAASRARVAASNEFATLTDKITRYRARKNQTTIPLREVTFQEQRETENETALAPTPDGNSNTSDYFLEELLAITRDYARALSEK